MYTADLENLTYQIIGAAYEVRKTLGRFLYEEVYEHALQAELKLRGIESRRQVYLPVFYKGICLDKSYRMDLLIEEKIPIELKTMNMMGSREVSQILTYLTLSGLKVGYLMNFWASDFCTSKVPDDMALDKGIYRIVN